MPDTAAGHLPSPGRTSRPIASPLRGAMACPVEAGRAPFAPGSGAPARGGVRARELGVAPGIFDPGPLNAITDVGGVRVGHATVVEGDAIRTGVTAVLPHGANLYLD